MENVLFSSLLSSLWRRAYVWRFRFPFFFLFFGGWERESFYYYRALEELLLNQDSTQIMSKTFCRGNSDAALIFTLSHWIYLKFLELMLLLLNLKSLELNGSSYTETFHHIICFHKLDKKEECHWIHIHPTNTISFRLINSLHLNS